MSNPCPPMDVKTLCLGLLSQAEASGYDLKKALESRFRHFFVAGYGSIYPALAELARLGLVECRNEPQDGRPDRKVYRVTAAGRARFTDRLRRINPQHRLRSEFLAVLYFAELLPAERRAELLADRLAQLRAVLVDIEQAPHPDAPGARFVAGFGAAVARAAADYIEQHGHLLGAAPRKDEPTSTNDNKARSAA
jgi:PadR family transcriptional regulator AphA